MEKLVEDLTVSNSSVEILVTPKYHCELAGEGIEYGWGFAKKCYRNLPQADKRTKEKFHQSVMECLQRVTPDHCRRFSGRARRYMIAYQHFASRSDQDSVSEKTTYSEIEKFVKKCKTHRNIIDQEAGYISQLWKQSIGANP